jgi:ribose 5-phosphate isomerase B
MRVSIGCDENGVDLKNFLIKVLEEKKIDYVDYWEDRNDPLYYLEVAKKVIEGIQRKDFDRGILICGTGLGMAIYANKFKGIRAAICHDIYSTRRSILSNDCQVLTMGAYVIGQKRAQELLHVWLDTKRTGGSVAKLKKMSEIVNDY